jgi:ABC-type glycerol-3-phosphate transport system substrate-binding protein
MPLAVFGAVALLISACGGVAAPENDTATPSVASGAASTPSTELGPAVTTTTSPAGDPGVENEDAMGDELEQLLQDLSDADAKADALEGVPELN